eukprot:TRINITY_DN31884_c0_g2_i1.p2 TRINITY_DN31884_c0_g2~~TRINITY_DN31884_c0_g2_i1.p2  ORF type:complete len:131 (+),score=22.88 TRINITY_DN31884_c0_g2_i1:417-809(+)
MTEFLGTVDNCSDDQWTAMIQVNGHPSAFKLDTEASVSVIDSSEPWLKQKRLQRPNKVLRGPGGVILPSHGTLHVTLDYCDRTIQETVYVLNNQPCSLLSRRAGVELGIVKRVDAIDSTVNNMNDTANYA